MQAGSKLVAVRRRQNQFVNDERYILLVVEADRDSLFDPGDAQEVLMDSFLFSMGMGDMEVHFLKAADVGFWGFFRSEEDADGRSLALHLFDCMIPFLIGLWTVQFAGDERD